MFPNSLRQALCVCVLCAALCGAYPASAGVITGHLLDPYGVDCQHIYYGANIAGSDPQGVGFGTTTLGGLYRSNDLPVGTYSMGWSEKDGRGRFFRFGVQVPEKGHSIQEYKFRMNTYVMAGHWLSPWPKEIRQSFRATGKYINQIALRTAGGRMRISVHKGDVEPLGPQIGPWREVLPSNTNSRGVYWSAGLVPTVPGEIYTVRIVSADTKEYEAVAPFVETIRKWGGDAIPDGSTWADGKITNTPPELNVSSDDDGIISTLSAANEYKHATSGKVFGQTFTAMGTSVVGAIFLTGDDKLYALSVHDGPGEDGLGGKQIGPTKHTVGVPWDGRTVTTWMPGEVPVDKGHVYFLKISKVDNSDIIIYTTKNTPGGDDQYPGGLFYKDGVAYQEYDLSGSIFEEESTGSATVPFVRIDERSIKVSRGPEAATIEWTTDLPVKGFVDWGRSTPYTEKVSEDHATTSHKLRIKGLAPNTSYHYRVGGSGEGCRANHSHDSVFVTSAATTDNLLSNPGFESGTLAGWTRYGDESADAKSDGWHGPARPHTGQWAFAQQGDMIPLNGGVYQTVRVKPGDELKASMWLFTHQDRANWRFYDGMAYGRIGIDPTGGTDPQSPRVIWSPNSMALDRHVNFGVEAEASSGKATVFCEGKLLKPVFQMGLFVIDDVVLTREAKGTQQR